MKGFRCSTCGEYHDELPLVLGAPAPAAYEAIPSAEREQRASLSSDQCVIDDKHFFILGRLELPVTDGPHPFTWLTWVSLSEKNFLRASELWRTAGRESEEPYFARVQSALPYPGGTLSLQASVHTQPVGQRPLVLLLEADHPLYREQQHGITMARVQQIVESALHAA
ncbi:MAG: DUF2199 domain-containing protein [Thermomicrobiales bacterium]|jgi:hypothetical protein|nr:MAG: DUF2199 domain-containing protein [Thermomicrobiales bacterium]